MFHRNVFYCTALTLQQFSFYINRINDTRSIFCCRHQELTWVTDRRGGTLNVNEIHVDRLSEVEASTSAAGIWFGCGSDHGSAKSRDLLWILEAPGRSSASASDLRYVNVVTSHFLGCYTAAGTVTDTQNPYSFKNTGVFFDGINIFASFCHKHS